MILGLDISTSCIGFCVLENRKVVLIDFLDLSKIKSIFEKADLFKEKLISIKKTYKIKEILIEENLQAFRPGLSSAKTIVSLARFNGMCSLVSFKVFEKEPAFVNVNSARKSLGFKKDRKSSKNTKDQVLDFVMQREPQVTWPTKTLKSGPRKDTVVLVKECYDMADAYVIAYSQKQETLCQEQKK